MIAIWMPSSGSPPARFRTEDMIIFDFVPLSEPFDGRIERGRIIDQQKYSFGAPVSVGFLALPLQGRGAEYREKIMQE